MKVWKRWFLAIALGANSSLLAQSFSSGSTGADGDLIVSTPGITEFTQTPVGGGAIFNFKSIQIAAGATLHLSGQRYSSPLFFLAQNAVSVAGTIDLSGGNGEADNQPSTSRVPSIPGPGGFGGGLGSSGSNAAQAGNGPGGGQAALAGAPGCARYAQMGTFSGNQFLVPLVGGSGGGGGIGPDSTINGGGGGAGGGALLIASSVSISVTGSILANAGSGSNGTPFQLNYPIPYSPGASGSGGAIRLVAPIVSGSGTLNVQGTTYSDPSGCGSGWGGGGIIRLEAFQQNFTGSIPLLGASGLYAPKVYYGSPYNLYLPTAPPTIRVVSIGGIPVSSTPTGTFTVPDVTVNSSSPLTIQIQASNIPLGTTATVLFSSENGSDQTVTSSSLVGTVASSTATASVTLPSGFSRGYVKATWTQ